MNPSETTALIGGGEMTFMRRSCVACTHTHTDASGLPSVLFCFGLGRCGEDTNPVVELVRVGA